MGATTLPGVRVGPLDPDATEAFGSVAAQNSARQLIRLHRQMHPPELLRALVRIRDDARSKGLDFDEVADHVGTLKHKNGDAVLPEGAEIVGAAVRGDPRTGQVLTFTYRLPSGRVGKWFTDYSAEALPTSFDQGAELAKAKELSDRGVVALDSEGTQAEILRRQLSESRREAQALRKQVEARGETGDEVPPAGGAEFDTRGGEQIASDNEDLRRQNEELKARVAQFEQLAGSAGGGVPTAGLEEDFPPRDGVASADEPVEGYDDLKADDAAKLLRDENTSQEQRQRILDYEKTHANRKTVVSAGEEALDRG